MSVEPGFCCDICVNRLCVRFRKVLLYIFITIFDYGIFHGINTISYLKTPVIVRFQGLIDNRVGVGRVFNPLKYNNKEALINKVICIINGIFYGIECVLKSENIHTMKGKLMLPWY